MDMTQILLVALIKKNIAKIIGYDSDRYVPVLAIAIGKSSRSSWFCEITCSRSERIFIKQYSWDENILLQC